MNQPAPAPAPAKASIIGAGPAGLMAAEVLAQAGVVVHVFDRMPSPARKLLIAGRGGLNLTHSEPLDAFLQRYGEAAERLAPAVRAFPPEAVRAWAEGLGQETFVGSSGRIFPRAMKASPLLRAWLARLASLGVGFHWRHRFVGFEGDRPLIEGPEGRVLLQPPVLFALGGASWPRLGSDAAWVEPFRQAHIPVSPFAPSNAGVRIAWSAHLAGRFAGEPLKRIELRVGDVRRRGEAMIDRQGLEGGAVYAVFAQLRAAIASQGAATLHVDLRPDMTAAALAARIAGAGSKPSMATLLRKAAGLSPAASDLTREAGALPRDPQALAARIKDVPLTVTGLASIERAISSAGGVPWSAIAEDFSLRSLPGVYVAGEMIDWDAPTGGYLLQACFATGAAAARGMLEGLENGRAS